MAQVLDDLDSVNARETIDDSSPRFIEVDVHGKRWQVTPGVQRPALDGVVREHRDLVARHVDRRHTSATNLVERRPRCEITPRGCNVDPNPQPPVSERGDGKCIVDLGRRRIVNRKGLDAGIGQGLGDRRTEGLREGVIPSDRPRPNSAGSGPAGQTRLRVGLVVGVGVGVGVQSQHLRRKPATPRELLPQKTPHVQRSRRVKRAQCEHEALG